MRKPVLKSTLATFALAAVMASCGPTLKITKQPLSNDISDMPEKNAELSKEQLKSWPFMGIIADTVPGMSVTKAYDEIIRNRKGETVIVAVLDAGVDIEHEDLDGVLWTNKDEVPNNGIDDDNNGYVDDIHGWNFLGGAVNENLELTRIVKKYKDKFGDKSADEVSEELQDEYALYKRAKKTYDDKYAGAKQDIKRYKTLKERFTKVFDAVTEKMGGTDFTRAELVDAEFDTEEGKQYKTIAVAVMRRADKKSGEDFKQLIDGLGDAYEYFNNKLEYYLNLDFDGRAIVGDDVDDLSDRNYGDNRVDGPTEDKEDVMHGTHVAGIIAAERHNDIGMKGVANNVEIMAIRAVPNGDEYDKDIALGIRYAVDNGASIINMSFGKSFSTHPDWVMDALKYAAKHDVLIVHAAGNDGLNLDLDENFNYPNDHLPHKKGEVMNNVLTVGALNYVYGEGLVAPFSNYGSVNVDVFAPGMKIYSTTPLSTYEFLQGTSMASPEVAGVAAMIRSYFPKLSAEEVKNVIMKSGMTTSITVVPGGNEQNETSFDEISKSGKIVNLYNALIMASKL